MYHLGYTSLGSSIARGPHAIVSRGLASAMTCPDCKHNCISLNECIKKQEWNIIVEQAQAVAKLKKHIQAVPYFQGKKEWIRKDPEFIQNHYHQIEFNSMTPYQYRFMTITFDPKKFSFNELTQPDILLTYFFKALHSLKNLFKENPIIIVEYHKTGIPHIHMNYSTHGPLEHATLELRMRYYFSKTLRNKRCIHDRIFNDGGKQYITKSNTHYYTFKTFIKPLEKPLEIII